MVLSASRRVVVRTDDIDDAEQTLGKCYLPLRLRAAGHARRIDTGLDTVDLGCVTLGGVWFGSEVRMLTDPASNFHVNFPIAGSVVSRPGTATELVTRRGTAEVFRPEFVADLRWGENTRQVCLMLDRLATERHLAAMVGHELN